MNNCYIDNMFKKRVSSWTELKKKIVADWVRYENVVSYTNGSWQSHLKIPTFRHSIRNLVATEWDPRLYISGNSTDPLNLFFNTRLL